MSKEKVICLTKLVPSGPAACSPLQSNVRPRSSPRDAHGMKFSPCRSSRWGFHPILPQPPDAVTKRLLINMLSETGSIALLRLSAGRAPVLLTQEVTLIWKHPVSKTAGATICQQHVRAACCAACSCLLCCLLLPMTGKETLPRLLKAALLQPSLATNPARKAASMLITHFQGQMKAEGCSAGIRKDKMHMGKEKHHSSFSSTPAQSEENEKSPVHN